MKKLFILLVVLALMVPACCTRIDPTTNATTKSFSNCLAAAQQILCNPTAAQQQEAAAVVTFLTSGVQAVNFVIPIPITTAEVVVIFSAIEQGGCVLATNLQLAVDWYNSLAGTLKAQTAAKGVKKAVAAPVAPSIPLIQSWITAK